MNKLFIVGNLTKDPELRTTTAGENVCTFTVAVNRRKKNRDGTQEADFFRVSAWRQLGDNCAKYLAKGRKVNVIGPVRVKIYKTANGETGASMEVTADDVEFLSPASQPREEHHEDPAPSGFTEVEMGDDDLPF